MTMDVSRGARRDEHRRVPRARRGPRVAGVSLGAAEWLAVTLSSGDRPALTDQDVFALASVVEVQRLPRGQLLYQQGVLPSGVWGIRSGEVELATGTGRQRSIVQMLRAGHIVGDVYLFNETPPPVTARTARESEVIFISAERLSRLMQLRPHLATLWLRSASRRAVESNSRVLELLTRTAAGRLARLLLREADGDVLEMSQASIAQMLGAGRPSVNRMLRALERQGLVSLGYGHLRVLDRDGLRELADGAEPVDP